MPVQSATQLLGLNGLTPCFLLPVKHKKELGNYKTRLWNSEGVGKTIS